ncbi:hypothetical protein, partial [Aeromonas caviae]
TTQIAQTGLSSLPAVIYYSVQLFRSIEGGEGCQKCDPGGIIEPHPRVISTRSLLMKIGKIA